jgi:hypothetical protein
MKIKFPQQDNQEIVSNICNALGGRELGKIVDFKVVGNDLNVTISKMGTSELLFSGTKTASGWEYQLSKEKIAFTHRPFKDDVIAKIRSVIISCGGTVS